MDTSLSDIPMKDLPKCEKHGCGALVRPDIIWFGENLNKAVLEKASQYYFYQIHFNINIK